MLGAILTALAFLSGLTDAECYVLRERARTAFHPEQDQMQKWLIKARDEVRDGIQAAKRLIWERCQIAEGEASNSEVLAGTRSAAA